MWEGNYSWPQVEREKKKHTGNRALVQKYTELAAHFGPIRLRSVFASCVSVCECECVQVFVCLWLTQYLDGFRYRLMQTWGGLNDPAKCFYSVVYCNETFSN